MFKLSSVWFSGEKQLQFIFTMFKYKFLTKTDSYSVNYEAIYFILERLNLS